MFFAERLSHGAANGRMLITVVQYGIYGKIVVQSSTTQLLLRVLSFYGVRVILLLIVKYRM